MTEIKKKPYKILQDTREQLPLKFRDEFVVEIKGLPFADYWFENENGYEFPIVVERKGIGDLFGTMGTGYARFKNEMLKCSESQCHMIILIEGTMRDVAKGYEHSKFDGESMLKKLFMLQVRYDITVVYGEDRATCSRYIEELADALWRNWNKTKKDVIAS